MERKRYLELCQKYAVGYNARVLYNEIEYFPYRYELSFDNQGKCIHRAILKDINANSIIYCKLKDVKESNQNEKGKKD